MRFLRTLALPIAFTMMLLLLSTSLTHAQPVADEEGDVAVGTNIADPSALLDLVSTNKGMLAPRMTTADRNAIPSPAEGLLVYDIDDNRFYVWSSASGTPQWDAIVTTGNQLGWLTDGNNGLVDATNNFLGTNDATPVRFITDGTERMIIETDGDIAVNATAATTSRFHVEADAGQSGITALAAGSTDLPDPFNIVAVWGAATGLSNVGVLGYHGTGGSSFIPGAGVSGASDQGVGVAGTSSAVDGAGVFGSSMASAPGGYGVQGYSLEGGAAQFEIDNGANANTAVEILTSGTGDALNVSATGGGNAINATGHIVPGATNSYDLGASTARWDEIYVNGLASIHLGVDGDEAHITYDDGADIFGLDFNADNAPEFTVDDAGNVSFSGSLDLGFTQGSVLFEGASGVSEDNANFFFDDANDQLTVTSGGGSAAIPALGYAIRGDNGTGVGVMGTSDAGGNAAGVAGLGIATDGVYGLSSTGGGFSGVRGRNDATTGNGVRGESNGGGTGVQGYSQTGIGGDFTSDGANGTALRASASGTSGIGLRVTSGATVLSYSTIANGGTIPDNITVAYVTGDGANATQASVTLPGTGISGQVLIVTTDDPDGIIINGGSAPFQTITPDIAVRYIRAGSAWIVEN